MKTVITQKLLEQCASMQIALLAVASEQASHNIRRPRRAVTGILDAMFDTLLIVRYQVNASHKGYDQIPLGVTLEEIELIRQQYQYALNDIKREQARHSEPLSLVRKALNALQNVSKAVKYWASVAAFN